MKMVRKRIALLVLLFAIAPVFSSYAGWGNKVLDAMGFQPKGQGVPLSHDTETDAANWADAIVGVLCQELEIPEGEQALFRSKSTPTLLDQIKRARAQFEEPLNTENEELKRQWREQRAALSSSEEQKNTAKREVSALKGQVTRLGEEKARAESAVEEKKREVEEVRERARNDGLEHHAELSRTEKALREEVVAKGKVDVELAEKKAALKSATEKTQLLTEQVARFKKKVKEAEERLAPALKAKLKKAGDFIGRHKKAVAFYGVSAATITTLCILSAKELRRENARLRDVLSALFRPSTFRETCKNFPMTASAYFVSTGVAILGAMHAGKVFAGKDSEG